MNKVIVITGQTATGKTKYALELATKYKGELINCDSRQIYKYLDIITGKDIQKNSKFKFQISNFKFFTIGYYLINGIRLWLYDIVDPKQYFSSFDYVSCARFVLKDIISRGKTPIIIGGSGLYLKHLIHGFDAQVPPNWALRKKLEKQPLKTLQNMFNDLKSERLTLNNSDFNNPRRLIRHIEILSAPLSNIAKIPDNPYSFEIIGLKYKHKNYLIKAIKTRVEKRLKQGAIDEVKQLLDKGYTADDPGLKTIGYQQLIKYLKKDLTKDEATDQWVIKEVQYAKRQLTYLKKYLTIKWREV